MESDCICRIRKLTKRYGTTVAVRTVDLDLSRNELISIIGPSGAGKTTLLRLIAGIEQPDGGEIRLSAPASARSPVVLVFQDFALFPTMSVERNVGFGLHGRGMTRREVAAQVGGLLEALGIAEKAKSFPNLLSAGQQQRVALARAIAVRPQILLLDEPFGHLDKTLKMDTALYLRQIQREFGITMMAVTHDLSEAFAMSDRVGIMIDGALVQIGSAEEIHTWPASLEVARFLGPVNLFPAELLSIIESESETVELHAVSGRPGRAVGRDTARVAEAGADVRLFCRAESMRVIPDPSGAWTVADVTFTGTTVLYRVHARCRGADAALFVFSMDNGIKAGTRVRVRASRLFAEGDYNESD